MSSRIDFATRSCFGSISSLMPCGCKWAFKIRSSADAEFVFFTDFKNSKVFLSVESNKYLFVILGNYYITKKPAGKHKKVL